MSTEVFMSNPIEVIFEESGVSVEMNHKFNSNIIKYDEKTKQKKDEIYKMESGMMDKIDRSKKEKELIGRAKKEIEKMKYYEENGLDKPYTIFLLERLIHTSSCLGIEIDIETIKLRYRRYYDEVTFLEWYQNNL